MNLHAQIQTEMQKALREGDKVRLSVLRGLLSAFTNELVAMKRKPHEELPDVDVLKVIARAAKQRNDSIDQFLRGNREDLANKEKEELEVLKTYIPEQMSREKIAEAVKAKQKDLEITDPKQKGLLMQMVMRELKGKADGKTVKEIVDELLGS